MHRGLASLARISHKSLNQLIVDALAKVVDGAGLDILGRAVEKPLKPKRNRKPS